MKTARRSNGESVFCYQESDTQTPAFRHGIHIASQRWKEHCEAYLQEFGDRGQPRRNSGIAVWYLGPRQRKVRTKIVIDYRDFGHFGCMVGEASADDVVRYLHSQGIEAFYWPGQADYSVGMTTHPDGYAVPMPR